MKETNETLTTVFFVIGEIFLIIAAIEGLMNGSSATGLPMLCVGTAILFSVMYIRTAK